MEGDPKRHFGHEAVIESAVGKDGKNERYPSKKRNGDTFLNDVSHCVAHAGSTASGGIHRVAQNLRRGLSSNHFDLYMKCG